MLDLALAKKQKVCLSDYPAKEDIRDRVALSSFSPFDVQLLEEILYSPLKIPLKKLAKSLEVTEERLLNHLKKFIDVSLCKMDGDTLLIDKEKRKNFEFHLGRFAEDFRPDMEFLQELLRKVPIHILPTWYSIPRSSSNIFKSIVEKYLFTPQIFQRYLAELQFPSHLPQAIIDELFASDDLKIEVNLLLDRYNVSRAELDEALLLLEFHFVATFSFERHGDLFIEVLTPFYEWREYLLFLKRGQPDTIDRKAPIIPFRKGDFAFIEEMSALLVGKEIPHLPSGYLERLQEKIVQLQLGTVQNGKVIPSPAAEPFLDLSPDHRSLSLYRHPRNTIPHLPTSWNERMVREAEKSIKRVLHGEWVLLEPFLDGISVPIHEQSTVQLKMEGKQWHYTTPQYSREEREVFAKVVTHWLFELGMVSLGSLEGATCFRVTPFGSFFFDI